MCVVCDVPEWCNFLAISYDNFLLLYLYRIRKDYEEITDKALTTPTNTQHLMELKEFIQKAEEKDLVELDERMVEARHRSEVHTERDVQLSI